MMKRDRQMKKFDGLIFDVDGTLWDSTKVVAKAWTKAFEEEGYDMQICADRLKGLFGLPMDDIIADLLPDSTYEERQRIAPCVYKYEEEFLYENAGELYPDLELMMRTLAKEYRIFIVSNCQKGYIELFCDKTGLGDIVADHSCFGDNNLMKSDNIKLIVKRHNLSNPVYIGDTQMDADACREAGCPIIYAAYGFGNVAEPDYVINKPMDLVELLEGKDEA